MREFKVGTFLERHGHSKELQVIVKTSYYNSESPDCIEYSIFADNIGEAGKIAISKRKEHEKELKENKAMRKKGTDDMTIGTGILKQVHFDQGIDPVISCVNISKLPISDKYNFTQMIKALQKQITRDFKPIWGAHCTLIPSETIHPKTWGLVFADNADVANAYGYHELTKDGFPISYVLTEVTKEGKEENSVTASHEILEMLVDPAIQMLAAGPKGLIYAYETADAVQSDTYLIDNVPVSNFVYPAWFESFRKTKSTKFDFLGHCIKPFQIRNGGYMPVFNPRSGWTQIFANKTTEKKFKLQDHTRTMKRVADKFELSPVSDIGIKK